MAVVQRSRVHPAWTPSPESGLKPFPINFGEELKALDMPLLLPKGTFLNFQSLKWFSHRTVLGAP